jgi:hypothetical protein
VLLTEGFASAWRNASQTATTGVGADITNGSNILLTIAGLPAGVTANLSRVVIGSAATQVGIALTSAALSSAATTSTLSFSTAGGGTAPNLSTVESIAFDIVLTGGPTGTLPLAPGSVTLSVTHTPNSTSGLTAGLPTTTAGYPRFTTATTTVTIATIGSATTTLLVPFVARVGTQYDTGLAIANTTKDPFGAAGGATPGTGNMTFNLFPRSIVGTAGGAGTQTTIVTSATVRPGFNGGGLDATGLLPAGGTWSATLSELMAAGSVSGDFIGYIFIQTNFVDAHGVSYILDNGSLSSAVPILVLQPPAAVSRNVAGAESLGF